MNLRQILIGNALKPAEIQDTALCFELGRATVVVPEEQLSLAIGKRGQNVRLAARLTGWDIDILTPAEYNRGLDRLASTLKKVEGVEDVVAERISLLGLIGVVDVEEVGAEPLIRELELTEELAQRIVVTCTEEAKLVREEEEKKKSSAAKTLKESGSEGTVSSETEPTDSGDESASESDESESDLSASEGDAEGSDSSTDESVPDTPAVAESEDVDKLSSPADAVEDEAGTEESKEDAAPAT